MRGWWIAAAGVAMAALGCGTVAAVRWRDQAMARLAAAEAAPVIVAEGAPLAGLVTLLADRASVAGVRLSARVAAGGMAGIEVDARGGEAAIRSFATAIETQHPAMRLVRWSVMVEAAGLVRLRARAVPLPPTIARSSTAAWLSGADGGEPLFDTSGSGGSVPAPLQLGIPRLVGIVGRVGAAEAMVRLPDGSLRTLRPGDRAGAWRLVAVAPDRARFVDNGQEQVSVLPTATDAVPVPAER